MEFARKEGYNNGPMATLYRNPLKSVDRRSCRDRWKHGTGIRTHTTVIQCTCVCLTNHISFCNSRTNKSYPWLIVTITKDLEKRQGKVQLVYIMSQTISVIRRKRKVILLYSLFTPKTLLTHICHIFKFSKGHIVKFYPKFSHGF